MPPKSTTYKKYGKPYFKRKHYKQKYGKKGNKPVFRAVRPYGIKADPFPRVLHTRLKYTFGRILSTATTIDTYGTEYVFSLDSIYDPNYTINVPSSNNKSTVGLTQLQALYERYIVKGAKIEVTFNNPSQDGIVGACSFNQTAILQGNTVRVCNEQSKVYTTHINNSGTQRNKMSFYSVPWSHRGLSKLEWMANRSDHSSSTAGNPTSRVYFRVGIANIQDATAATMRVDVKIIYYVELYDRKQLSSTYY